MKYLIKNKAWDLVEDYNTDKLFYLLIDRPNYISGNNNFLYRNNKEQLHRSYDLPAILYSDGEIVWYKIGQYKRENNKPIRICF